MFSYSLNLEDEIVSLVYSLLFMIFWPGLILGSWPFIHPYLYTFNHIYSFVQQTLKSYYAQGTPVLAIITKNNKKTWHRLTRIQSDEFFDSIIYKLPHDHTQK